MPESILKQLENTREKMIQSALENGFRDVNTIRLSKELDRLLNLYQFKDFPEKKLK
ncbi:aspartyl-phosphate phosphatase Spo0E family protein [Paenisporosarcina indica]|uniref:aspartyl-phosphate phosphatase Spo0E family protein n=1 Tax=Paenisporosarcina indica TaxID=650093 RepID=UPI0009503428|nr:aspartyl-phosphate phosphatase Spo0E family protein [Paenisporosarcina indica]